jgi:anti-sigma regulatory factor (Ser/Thr protein kinase)
VILRLSLDLPEDAAYVTMTRLMGRTALQYLNVTPTDVGDVETILDELTSNAVRHARSHDGRFRLTLDYYAEKVVITVEDNGPGFRPDAVPPPGTPRPDLDGGERLRGFGLVIVQAMTDRLEFHREGGGGTKVQAEKRLAYKTEADAHRAEGLNADDASAAVSHGGHPG